MDSRLDRFRRRQHRFGAARIGSASASVRALERGCRDVDRTGRPGDPARRGCGGRGHGAAARARTGRRRARTDPAAAGDLPGHAAAVRASEENDTECLGLLPGRVRRLAGGAGAARAAHGLESRCSTAARSACWMESRTAGRPISSTATRRRSPQTRSATMHARRDVRRRGAPRPVAGVRSSIPNVRPRAVRDCCKTFCRTALA